MCYLGDLALTESILILAVRHFLAASRPLPRTDQSEVKEEEIVALDLNCFISEIIDKLP